MAIFRDPRVDFLFFSISFANEISECLTEFWLLVLFLMSLQLSLLQGDSHSFLNACVWMPIVGSLATAPRWKPRLAEARLMLNLYFCSQEKGHCCELMTEQCSEMFDYPALHLCLLPPTSSPFLGMVAFFTLLPVVLQMRFCSTDSHRPRHHRYINRTLTLGQ